MIRSPLSVIKVNGANIAKTRVDHIDKSFFCRFPAWLNKLLISIGYYYYFYQAGVAEGFAGSEFFE
ncbi:hypothetical protein [Nitrosomonas sp.]|uniref:hypothetical protein n=1 Tax=Nitrosomonas sp. TaxID=42353 RepID=UPI00207DAF3D|nr:hypothetical protein [Nitrosomonas sp.]GJL73995.1 MAG: hypothetical protein NMNS02_01010 [Nitrosomonas sp.]